MKRREFVAASCLAGLTPLSALARAEDCGQASPKELYELRLYRMQSAAQRQAFCEFAERAAVAALNRAGVGPVGVFQFDESDCPDLYVLLPHKSLESVVTLTARMMADEEFHRAGAAVIDAPASAPAYERMESSLLLAFDEIPKLERPTSKPGRVFQLRTYESHSVKFGQKKIEMFNAGGELALFRRTAMPPVFFGEALVGTKLPNLTYMLGFDDMEAREAGWAKFLADPQWEKLKSDPQYKDTVSNITNIFLKPAACSQI